MTKLDELIGYLNNTSLFEKQQILNELLKDFRLDNNFKNFYEEELKKDKEKLKEVVEKEVSFKYEGKILLLTRDNESLNRKLNTINDSYNIQLESAKKLLDVQLNKVNETLKHEVKEKERIKRESDLTFLNLKSKMENEKSKLIGQKNNLENKIKSMGITKSTGNIYFMNSNYFILNQDYLSVISGNLLYLEQEILRSLKKIDGLKEIEGQLSFKYNLSEYILSNHLGFVVTESIVEEIFNYYKSLTLIAYTDNQQPIKYKPYDLLKNEIFDIETFYNEVIKEDVE